MNDTANIVQQSINGLIHRVDQSPRDPLTSQGLAPDGQVFTARGSGCDVGQLFLVHLTLAHPLSPYWRPKCKSVG